MLVDTKEISVTFYEKENNKLAYLDKEWALSNMSVNIGQLSYSTTKTHDLFNACVLYTSSNDFSDLTIKNIVISQSSKASFLQMLGRVRRQSEEERIRLMIRRINFQTLKVNFDHNESALRFMSEFFRLQTNG